MFLKKLALGGAMAVLAGTTASACEIGARVSVVGNEFPAIQTVGAEAQACTGAEVATNLTADQAQPQDALSAAQSVTSIAKSAEPDQFAPPAAVDKWPVHGASPSASRTASHGRRMVRAESP